jgi:predicted  nucleic acid-binding Zn-ribbon protein
VVESHQAEIEDLRTEFETLQQCLTKQQEKAAAESQAAAKKHAAELSRLQQDVDSKSRESTPLLHGLSSSSLYMNLCSGEVI